MKQHVPACDMVLRADIAAAWHGQDPLAAAFALTGDVLREMPGRRTLRVQIAGRTYIAKLHSGVGYQEIAKNLLVGRAAVVGAENEYTALLRLQSADVPSMQIAAFGSADGAAARRRSFILLDYIKHEQTLEDVARTWRTQPPTAASRRKLVLAVARIARAMHGAGVNHRDFYLCHFLCAAEGELRLIDLHRAGCGTQVAPRWRLKDLASLYFSAMDAGLSERDRLRFMRCYLGGRLPRGSSAWAMWRKVEAKAAWLYRKGQRLGIVG